MSIAQTRRQLYKASMFLGDVQALKRGRVSQRLYNRMVGRIINHAIRGVWK